MLLLMLPALTAVVVTVGGIVGALRPAARPLLWSGLALAVLNLALTPFTSGEWWYQRAEVPAYQEAVISADFNALNELTAEHDRSRLHKMIAIAAALLAAMSLLVSVQVRSSRDAISARTSAAANAAASTAAAVTAALVGLGCLAALYLLGPGE